MKTRIITAIALMTLALGTSAWAANFTAGNIVVYRVGTGSGALTNIGNAVFLDEYTTNGSFVQSLPMPTNYFGASSPLIAEGRAVSEGEITRSADGRFIVLTGYGATLGQITSFSLSSEFAQPVPRVVGLVDQFGHIDTTTTQTNFLSDIESIRSAASSDGTNLWFGGDANGIRSTTRGSALATQLSSFITDIRQLNIFSNQLYFSTGSGTRGIYVVTNGLPTTSGSFYQVLSNLQSSVSSPYGFVLLSLSGGPSGLNTLYVADDNSPGAIYKWSMLAGGAWASNGVVVTPNARFLTGTVNPAGKATLYIAGSPAAGGGNMYGYTDTAGWNAAPLGNGGTIGSVASWTVSVSSNQAFHGVAFAPVGGESFPSGAGRISVGPISDFFSTGLRGGPFPFTKTYSVANPGTSLVNWSATSDVNWVTLSPAIGSLASGSSTNVTASFNANANSLSGTNTATITFTNTTSALGTTTRPVKIIISDQSVTPTTAFFSSGPSNGPFAPLTKVYTLSNGVAPGTITWKVLKTATWLNLSATNGTLAGGAGTNITVSITNANSLAAGFYTDTILFTNTGAGLLMAGRNANLNIGSTYWFENFSTYDTGDLVGQHAWFRVDSSPVTLPLHVISGKVVIPAGQFTDNEDAYKSFPLTAGVVAYAGMSVTITSAPSSTSSYIAALNTAQDATGFANYRLSVRQTSPTTFAFVGKITGQLGSPSVEGPGSLAYNTRYRVIIATDVAGNSMTVYVNPTSTDLGSQIPYLTCAIGSGTPPPSVGSFVIAQFAAGNLHNAGLKFGKAAVSTSYPAVYTFLLELSPSSVNTWLASGTGPWTNAANWSLGLPDITHGLVQVTNSASKTVTYDVTSVQTISNLLVTAPAGTTNTLSASVTGITARGLTILDSLSISSGGALVWNGNAVLAGRELTVSGLLGGGITVDGIATIVNGKVLASNVVTTIGQTSFSKGQMTMSNGTFRAFSVVVGDAGAVSNSGTLNLLGGTMSSTFVSVGVGGHGFLTVSNFTLDVSTGFITCGNDGTLTTGIGNGQMTLANGADVTAKGVLLGSSAGGHGVMTIKLAGTLHIPDAPPGCAACGIRSNEGILDGGVIDSPGADMFAGKVHAGEMIVSNGVATFRSAFVGLDSTGTLTMPGGTMTVLSNMVVGDCGASVTGKVVVSGGNLFVTNATGTAVLDVRGGTVTLSAGQLKADKIVMTNGCGRLVHNGGTLLYNQLNLDPNQSAGGSGIPNGWALQYGLDPFDPNLTTEDPDGDGCNNLCEYLAGSNPVVDLKSITKEGIDIRVTWQAAAFKTNALQRSPGFNGSYSNNFADIFTLGAGLGGVTNYLDNGAATNRPALYYRIRLVP